MDALLQPSVAEEIDGPVLDMLDQSEHGITFSSRTQLDPRLLLFCRAEDGLKQLQNLLQFTQKRQIPPKIEIEASADSSDERADTLDIRVHRTPSEPLPQMDFQTASDTQSLFHQIMQAAIEGQPYLAVIFDLQQNDEPQLLYTIQQLCDEQSDLSVIVCAHKETLLEHHKILGHLIGRANLFLLRKPLLEVELSQLIISLIRLRLDEIQQWEDDGRHACAVRGSGDGVWDWNLNTNDFYISSRWKEMLGYENDEVPNVLQEWFQLIHPDDRKDVRAKLVEHIQGSADFFEDEYRILHKDGTYRWMLGRGRTVRGRLSRSHHLIGTQTEITLYKKLVEQQEHDVLHDPLTGLPNRALFLDRLEHAMVRGQRNKSYRFAVLVLYLERFKTILDSLGHSVGDLLLVDMARRLEMILPPTDSIARLGGAEFAILLDDADGMDRAHQIAERIQQSLSLPFSLAGQEVFTGASIGIASSKRRYEQPEEILRDADSAMNKAKVQGKARVEMFVTDMHVQAVTLLQMETDLRRAIERNEFRMFYQPIVSIQDGRIIGFEALIRWFKSERVAISPTSFIPVAEETGLILPIGKWVLEESCRQMRTWQDMFFEEIPLTINVNLSSEQFSQPDFLELVAQTLRDTRVEGRFIKLELTESVLMDNVDAAKVIFNKLQDMGILLCMDDFGTGYSSLSYLHRFPFDTLKIDRSFIKRMEKDKKHSEIVRTIVSLAQNLNMKVVAEGVETTHQLSALRELKCDYGQGYLFSKPVDSEQATALLTQRSR